MTGVADAMIVAGGAGTRLRPLTDLTPKPLLPFCGEPFLAGVLRRLVPVGVERVWLVVGADPSPFAVLEPVAAELGLEVIAVPEPTPLDTAGGVRSVIDRCPGSVLVLNGDVLTDLDLTSVVQHHDAARADATLVLTRVEDTSAFGVCVLDGTRVTGFVEKPPPGTLPGHDTVNAGTYVLAPGVLHRFEPGRLSFEREVFPTLVAAGARVEGLVSDAVWADLGTPERYLHGHRMALRGELAWPAGVGTEPDADGVRRGAHVEVDEDAEVVAPVLLCDGARVAARARVGPDVVVGANAVIGPDAAVRDTVLGAEVVVGAGARMTRCVAGPGARIAAGIAVEGPVIVGDGALVDPAHPAAARAGDAPS